MPFSTSGSVGINDAKLYLFTPMDFIDSNLRWLIRVWYDASNWNQSPNHYQGYFLETARQSATYQRQGRSTP